MKKGEDINSCGSKKDTPLQKANKRGHKSITQLLLDKETDTSSCKENKETPLHKACKRGHENVVFFYLIKEQILIFLTIRNKLLYI